MTHSFEESPVLSVRGQLDCDASSASDRAHGAAEDNPVGLGMIGLAVGPILAVIALMSGWGFLVALLAFSFGGSAAMFLMAVIGQWKSSSSRHNMSGTEDFATA